MTRAAMGLLPFLCWTVPALSADYDPALGHRHPEITLPDIATGKPVSISDFLGKKVLLIHFASW